MATDTLPWDAPTRKKFRFVGGNLALDFTNTVGGKRGKIARENLHSYLDFLSWCWQVGLVDRDLARGLSAGAAALPEEAAIVLARATGLREAIYRLFAAAAGHRRPAAEDLALLNRELGSGLGRLRIAAGKARNSFNWEWSTESAALDIPLGPVARAAAELLTSHSLLDHVRLCGSGDCGWLFIDSSKNHSRRWCDMRDCGNLAKVRRHRLKQQP